MRYCLVAGLIFLGDRLSKALIMAKMSLGESVPIIRPILYFTYVQNQGAAFGILQGRVFFLSALAILALFLVAAQWKKIAVKSPFVRWGIIISLVGAIGNLIDRLRWGAVIDFIDIRVFPIFNLADMAIVCGVALLFWEVLFHDRISK